MSLEGLSSPAPFYCSTHESGTWEITTRPTAMSGGKLVHARARRAEDPLSPPRDLTWAAHERIEVVRTPVTGLPATKPPRPPAKKRK